jgi:NADH pyrophosphatase NudC (nudix superfamily)
MTPEELKAHLMAEAEKGIEVLLGRKPKVEDITLSDIEQLAVQGGMNFREAVLASLVEESVGESQREERGCPQCGQTMQYKGQRMKDVVTEAGEVRVERAYYYCEHCRRGVFPPG